MDAAESDSAAKISPLPRSKHSGSVNRASFVAYPIDLPSAELLLQLGFVIVLLPQKLCS